MTQPPAARSPRRRLPLALYILAALMVVKAMLLLALVAGATIGPVRSYLAFSGAQELITAIDRMPGVAALLAAVALLLLASVVGMVSRRRTGWLVAMVLTGMFVGTDIIAFVNNVANHAWMLFNIVTVFYLNQTDVREAVGAAVPEAAPTMELTP